MRFGFVIYQNSDYAVLKKKKKKSIYGTVSKIKQWEEKSWRKRCDAGFYYCGRCYVQRMFHVLNSQVNRRRRNTNRKRIRRSTKLPTAITTDPQPQ